MTDQDYLNVLLEIEKNINNNLSVALNEASNDLIYQSLKNMFDNNSNMQQQLFKLAYSMGWYQLEPALENKINEKKVELETKSL